MRNFKKFLALVLATLMVASMMVFTAPAASAYAPTGDYADDIALLNAFGVDVAGASINKFADVSASAWYAPYVAKGYELGVTSGISDTMFGSGREITREEASAMALSISKAFGKSFNADGTVFTDDASISNWAKDAVYALKGAGVINGIGDGSFAPKANCTRAQAAVIIYALINR